MMLKLLTAMVIISSIGAKKFLVETEDKADKGRQMKKHWEQWNGMGNGRYLPRPEGDGDEEPTEEDVDYWSGRPAWAHTPRPGRVWAPPPSCPPIICRIG